MIVVIHDQYADIGARFLLVYAHECTTTEIDETLPGFHYYIEPLHSESQETQKRSS